MGEEIRQQATKHAAALAAIDRLNQNLQHGTGHIVADQRRAMDAAGGARRLHQKPVAAGHGSPCRAGRQR